GELGEVTGELLVLGGDDQHGPTDAGIGQGAERIVDQAVLAERHQGLVPGRRSGGLLGAQGTLARGAHARAETAREDHGGGDPRAARGGGAGGGGGVRGGGRHHAPRR